jgi:hypothetical protein
MQVHPARAARKGYRLVAVVVLLSGSAALGANTQAQGAASVSVTGTKGSEAEAAVLWREPTDLESRDLFYGPGGEAHQPRGPFTFVKEDLAGTNPKFDAKDRDGIRWKIKLGVEARPETVAARLVWAVGYAADEDYFLSTAQVQEMPAQVHRGGKLIGPDGVMHNVRVKREAADEGKKIDDWRWRADPFSGTRELNGLRVLMAVINNWDLKDVNNAVIRRPDPSSGGAQLVYEVSDLGSSFGAAGLDRTAQPSTGDLRAYRRTHFITHLTPDTVGFEVPRHAGWLIFFNLPEFVRRLNLRWIGRDIPRQDARWMGGLLHRLSSNQIRDAFRAAGYSPEDIDGFAIVLASRIAQLNDL